MSHPDEDVSRDVVMRALHSDAPPEIEDLLACAQAHGEDDDPDHEVGDLQDLLRACWAVMTPEQREAGSQAWIDTMHDTLCFDECPDAEDNEEDDDDEDAHEEDQAGDEG